MTRHPARVRSAAVGCSLAILAACASVVPPRGTIGAMLARRDGTGEVRVVTAPSDLGAARAGVRAGDRILTIDGEDVRRLPPQALLARLNGPVGTPVRLTLVRGETIVRVTVLRTKARKHGGAVER